MKTFKCQICLKSKPQEDSVSLDSKTCVTCFTSIHIHKRVSKKIKYFKKTLLEDNELTSIRQKKLRSIEKLNEIFSFSRGDILELNSGDIDYFIEEFHKNDKINLLRYWKKKYIVREYDRKDFNLEKMAKTLVTYKTKINDANKNKSKFYRFIHIIGKESQFKVLKDMLRTSLYNFIDNDNPEIYKKLRNFIIDGVAEIWEPGLMPNVSLFLHNNYEYIFSTIMTELFPFNKERISFDFPTVNSRTDFGLKLFYRYNHVELNTIDKAIAQHCDPKKKMTNKNVAKFLFINSIKTITRILDDIFVLYYKKLKIDSTVKSIVNIGKSSQTSTKRYNEVVFWINMREW
jgi:hypothetical protein